MATKKMRVVIPRNPSELLDLAAKIYGKHLEDATKSPLGAMNDRSWTTEGPRVAVCQEKHTAAEEARKLSESLTKECNIVLPDIDAIVKASRDVLLGINRDNPKRLAEWGFTVIESAATKPKGGNDKK
jgi:hypothetical protein